MSDPTRQTENENRTWPTPAIPPDGWPAKDVDTDRYAAEPLSGLLKTWYEKRLDDFATDKQTETDAEVARLDRDWQAEKASIDAEIALFKAIHDARVEVAKGAIARGQAGAEFVRNASAAIVTIYTGILGLVFGKEAFAETPAALKFPLVGLIPALFLAFALAAAAYYVAYLTRAPAVDAPIPSSSYRVLSDRRLNVFVDWVSQIALNRVYWLHAAVIALSFGVLFLPIAFTRISSVAAWVLAGLAALATLILPVYTAPETPNDPDDGGGGGGVTAGPHGKSNKQAQRLKRTKGRTEKAPSNAIGEGWVLDDRPGKEGWVLDDSPGGEGTKPPVEGDPPRQRSVGSSDDPSD